MRNSIDNFGKTAGKIWKILERYGPLNEDELILKTKINKNDFYAGIGWLARENKICKIGTRYQLGETNLTEFIGENAGKIWQTLNKMQDIDLTTITEFSNIKIKDAYSALGWLAREDKLYVSTGTNKKYKLK